MIHNENFQISHPQINFAMKTLGAFCWMVGYKVAKEVEQQASTFFSKIIIGAMSTGATELHKLVAEIYTENNENTPISGKCPINDDSSVAI